jgi:hypothetical protein
MSTSFFIRFFLYTPTLGRLKSRFRSSTFSSDLEEGLTLELESGCKDQGCRLQSSKFSDLKALTPGNAFADSHKSPTDEVWHPNTYTDIPSGSIYRRRLRRASLDSSFDFYCFSLDDFACEDMNAKAIPDTTMKKLARRGSAFLENFTSTRGETSTLLHPTRTPKEERMFSRHAEYIQRNKKPCRLETI